MRQRQARTGEIREGDDVAEKDGVRGGAGSLVEESNNK